MLIQIGTAFGISEPLKSKDQIAHYLDDNQCWPVPFGYFCLNNKRLNRVREL